MVKWNFKRILWYRIKKKYCSRKSREECSSKRTKYAKTKTIWRRNFKTYIYTKNETSKTSILNWKLKKKKEGYNKTVKSLLVACDKDSNLNKGIHGVLANLISVEKEYETAIEMCLGQSLQNIVTSTEQDAKKMIEYLRTNSLGRASFLPIASVQGKKLDKLTKMDGVIGIASDLVKCKKEYEQIILSLLGRTVVVEDMDTAIALAKKDKYSFRIVTF